MARNRKRRSDRRPDRPGNGARARPGVATARGQRAGRDEPDAVLPGSETPENAGDAVDPDPVAPESVDLDPVDLEPAALEHASPDVELAAAQVAVGRPSEPADAEELAEAEQEAVVRRPSAAPEGHAGNRLLSFFAGSWRELQRVQWPDRRQVMQATGVVIGFVIVAGVYLGVADWVATKIVHIILD